MNLTEISELCDETPGVEELIINRERRHEPTSLCTQRAMRKSEELLRYVISTVDWSNKRTVELSTSKRHGTSTGFPVIALVHRCRSSDP